MGSRASVCEFFREPDPQLGFLWGGLTMGMLLCIPLMLAGIAVLALCPDPRSRNRKMADEHSPLESEIRRLIAVAGPMPIAEYMRLCLTHPQYGYYINRDPLGAGGDFITAPEISQMFGELIGLWMASVWQQMGAPENVRLIELGPGRGTMMLDALRAAKVVPGFRAAIVLHLVEISPALQTRAAAAAGSCSTCRCSGIARSTTCRPAPASSSPTSSSMRCRSTRPSNRPTAGTSASSISRADGSLAIGAARDPLPHFEATLPRGLRLSPAGSIYEWRADSVASKSAGACATMARL